MVKHFFIFTAIILTHTSLNAQSKGNLFIIGGGTRTPRLMQAMLATAQLKEGDYIVVLPMASAETDTAFYYFKRSLANLSANPIVNFNFKKGQKPNMPRLDSLQKAKLIFIAGGDQSRFMQAVLNTPVYDAIHKAYANGATIAGTSAGAAVMSRYMITGRELLGDTAYHSTFRKVWYKNIEFEEGLGLLDSVIIDQHFIVRSRYNRLLSALASFPTYPCIGIDESTAIIVSGNKVSVTGSSQVILFTKPEGLQVTDKDLIKFTDLKIQLFTHGDVFELNY
ncbi:MAG: cyanophycinase [Bacteroidota bacterium]|nr:cyanophycinase [Bacteroidota bacterium]